MLTRNQPAVCVSLCYLQTRTNDQRVQNVLQSIQSAPAHSVAGLAQRAGLSISRLSHLFKRETGHGLRSFLTHYRLEKALELLQNAEMPVKEVSYLVGYRHSASFVRAFRKKFGCAPKNCRNASGLQNGIADSAN